MDLVFCHYRAASDLERCACHKACNVELHLRNVDGTKDALMELGPARVFRGHDVE